MLKQGVNIHEPNRLADKIDKELDGCYAFGKDFKSKEEEEQARKRVKEFIKKNKK